jgi:hypothetical protein
MINIEKADFTEEDIDAVDRVWDRLSEDGSEFNVSSDDDSSESNETA